MNVFFIYALLSILLWYMLVKGVPGGLDADKKYYPKFQNM